MIHTVKNYLDKVDEHLKIFLKESKEFKRDRAPGSHGQHYAEVFLPRDRDKVNLLFAVSGSGKTRKIEQLLSKTWGFYLLGCNLPRGSINSMHEPRRTNGSNDTWTLWQTH